MTNTQNPEGKYFIGKSNNSSIETNVSLVADEISNDMGHHDYSVVYAEL